MTERDDDTRAKMCAFSGIPDWTPGATASHKDWRFKLDGRLIGKQIKAQSDNLMHERE